MRAFVLAAIFVFFAVGVSPAREKDASSGSSRTGATPVDVRSFSVAAAWTGVPVGTIDPHVFQLALGATRCAVRSGAIAAPSTLTVIDYSKPSSEKRLWVFDLRSHELLFEELVAHGQGSGDNFARVFSNEPDTHASSLGLFRTDTTYVGRNGYSLRLDGLDEGFNHRARERAIVMHGAPYVSREFVEQHGRLGRSWGCPALREAIAREIIDRVSGNGILFAYYPHREWLESSRFLGDCDGPTTTDRERTADRGRTTSQAPAAKGSI